MIQGDNDLCYLLVIFSPENNFCYKNSKFNLNKLKKIN